MKQKMTADFLVIGGGVVGISVAREIQNRLPKAKVILIEKEAECGEHASGRNSGVIHAGFYYTADSLKARLTRQGNSMLTAYCEEQKIPLNKCGKLVVAKDADDVPFLDELLNRAVANGVQLESVTQQQMNEIEPRAKSFGGRALFSPTTSSVRPLQVLKSLKEEFIRKGGQVLTENRYVSRKGQTIQTSKTEIEAGHVVNAAGLYADKIAKDFGFSESYSIMPFKGLYIYCDDPPGTYKTHIYPVPNLKNPFLGVHFTLQTDGSAKIGPTAIPAFWREQYAGLENFDAGEFFKILGQNTALLVSSDFHFAQLAVEEISKYSRKKIVSLAAQLVNNIDPKKFKTWGKPGIRAQLVNTKTKKLEMDFVIQGDKSSTHVLNAVSPAFTCCLPFAKMVCDKMQTNGLSI